MHHVYTPRRAPASTFVPVRGLQYHVQQWGDAALATAARPALVMVHGWMDVGASFQFTVDALAAHEGVDRLVVAPDWRGFGLTAPPPGTDSYWFPDYLADLDALLDQVSPNAPVDLVGHSMGGNVAMSYAGVRPQRVRRLVNLEGFGLPRTEPDDAPKRLAQWLDQIRTPAALRDYDSLAAVAERLRRNNPRLSAAQAGWLAPHWSRRSADGRWQILGDPAHKHVNPVLYRVDEVLAGWRGIRAPLLWVEGAETDVGQWWGARYPRSEFDERLAVVADHRRVRIEGAGHMLHHDQPERLAEQLAAFLSGDGPPA